MPLEVTKARDISPTAGSLTILAGPPGVGKSFFAGTVAEFLSPEEVLVIATLPREANSLKYQEHNLDTILAFDEEWSPQTKMLKATGYRQLIEITRELRKDTKYKAVILDNGTEAAELAWHAAMEPLGVADPSALGKGGNRFAPYTSLRENMEQLLTNLSLLTGKIRGFTEVPKLVIIPWHIQPPKDSSDGEESADERGRGSEYEGEYLPMIRGSFRRRVGGLVDNIIYGDIVAVKANPKNPLSSAENHYCIQVISDKERHVKLACPQPDPARLVEGRYIDVHNNARAWRDFMSLFTQGS